MGSRWWLGSGLACLAVAALWACSSSDSGGSTTGTGGTAGGGATAGAAGVAGSAGSGKGGSAGGAGTSGAGGSAGSAEGGAAGSSGGGAGEAGQAGTAGAAGADGGTCSITFGQPCDGCVADKCLAECNTCAANPECAAAFDCVKTTCTATDGGIDHTCSANCLKAHPNGAQDFYNFWGGPGASCASVKCTSECGLTVANQCAQCDGCFGNTDCHVIDNDCNDDPACNAKENAWQQCVCKSNHDATVEAACDADFSSYNATAKLIVECAHTKCPVCY
jgi:hypothetical protein